MKLQHFAIRRFIGLRYSAITPKSRWRLVPCYPISWSVRSSAVSLALCCSLTASGAGARKVAEPGITPIQAELMSDVNARLLKVGAPVYAKVTSEWTGTSCFLRKGAVLEARVVSVSAFNRATALSELDLAFTQAQCTASKMATLDLILAAMAAPPRDSDLGILSDPIPVNTSGAGGIGNLGFSQMSANVDLKLGIDSSSYDFHDLPRMHMGDVSGIHGLKMSVGSGTSNSTVLMSKGHDVALEKHTILLLIPADGTIPRAESNPSPPVSPSAPVTVADSNSAMAMAPPAPLPVKVQPPDDLDLCDAVHCNDALPISNEIDSGKPEFSFSARQLGYASRPQRRVHDFDHDDALAWLGPQQLLVAFNAHELLTRHTLGPSGTTQRVIRAAILDTVTRRILRTVDWELPDNANYLWPLADNRVLVHVGSELRVYGEGLKISQRIALDGPLAFVRVTPDGNFLVIGQIRERHSPELHAQLQESLQGEPEEDVAVTVLNREFDTIAKSEARSNLMPPTLLNEGQARMIALPNRRYRVALLTWDGHSSVLANFSSACTPRLSSFAPDHLLLSSCNLHNGILEYRVLSSAGKLTLKGFSSPDDLLHTAVGVALSGTFAVKTLRSSTTILGNPFSASDLDPGELGVYRAKDGKRLLAVRFSAPSSSLDGFALASDGSQLAVLSRDQIAIYVVPRTN